MKAFLSVFGNTNSYGERGWGRKMGAAARGFWAGGPHFPLVNRTGKFLALIREKGKGRMCKILLFPSIYLFHITLPIPGLLQDNGIASSLSFS